MALAERIVLGIYSAKDDSQDGRGFSKQLMSIQLLGRSAQPYDMSEGYWLTRHPRTMRPPGKGAIGKGAIRAEGIAKAYSLHLSIPNSVLVSV